jgi:hypothetical protein
MGIVITIKAKPFLKRWKHKLFECPTFWEYLFSKKGFRCPKCNKKYLCYWDGNDVTGHGIDYCNKCAKELEG